MQNDTLDLKYKSFHDYLVDNGFFFSKELIEDFLLSIKVNPFIILFGNSGVGKTSLPALFSDYLSISLKKEDIIVHAVNSLGKSPSNREWHLKRDTLDEVLPILPFEGNECPFTINDSFSSVGKFKLDPRFRFSDKNLIDYLIQLQIEDPNQDLDLKIKIGEKSIMSNCKHVYDVGDDLCLFNDENELVNIIHYLKSENCVNIPENDLIHNFFVFEDLIEKNERKYLQFLDFINLNRKNREYYNHISLIGTVTTGDIKHFSQKLLDNVSVIELEQISLERYFDDNLNAFPEFHDLNYLEFKLFDENIINLDISGLKNILVNVYFNNRNLWDILTEELCKFEVFFRDFDLFFSFRLVNDILKFMVASWKYEGKPYIWDNWKRFFDSQIKYKLLPKIDELFYSKENFENLLRLCIDSSDEIMYVNSFVKVKNLIYNLKNNKVNYFNCFNHVKRFDVLGIYGAYDGADDLDFEDCDDIDDFKDVDRFIKELKGWEKLIYESICSIDSILFSLDDLKDLESLKIYQFEDRSLDNVIIENISKLIDYGLISDLNNGFYKKEV